MRLETHINRSLKLYGVAGEDIHKWIDAFFDHKRFKAFLRNPIRNRYNPYEHRKHRHYLEALELAEEEFKEYYSQDIIEKIFIQHLRDDYKGYVPRKADFDDPKFIRRYHNFLK